MNDEEILNSFDPDTLRLVSDFTSKVWNRGMLYESGAKATPENITRIDTLNIDLLRLIKAQKDEAYNKGFSNGYDTGLRDATTEPAPYKENS